MVSKKNTKKALLMSALSLLLCCSMLIGTTFAWFTDEVTSGKNQIIAGNLDVELEYSKDMSENSWKSVQGQTDLVDPNALWEPGHTEVVYLRISNLGTLALKYGLKMTFRDTVIGKSVDGNDIYLSEHLEYAVVDVSAKFASRDDARLEAEKTAQPLTEYTDNGVMKTKGEIKTVALVVYMPENVGNEANYRGEKIPQIELGLSLFATQYTHEEDSFDEMYDKATAVFTIEDAQALVDAGEDATLVNCHEPNGVLYADAAYTGTLTLVNSTIKAVQAEGDLDLVVLGDVVVNAKGTGISAFAVRPTENGSAISAKGKLSISGKGNLTAVAADVNGAFGIGGMEVKEIAIKDVTIDYVSGGYAYGVGSDTKYYKDAPEGGAAIGSGYDGAEISLSNVHVVKAIGGSKAAAIGARYHVGVNVKIVDSTIGYAEGGVSAAGIGGSRVSGDATEKGTTITISNSTITAKGGAYGAGIGSGYDTHCGKNQPLCTINIENSTINATGGKYAAGVGTGYHNAALAGEIKNSTVNAVSGEKFYKAEYTAAMGIGFGVTDPAREGVQTDSYIIYNDKQITLNNAPNYVEEGENLASQLKDGVTLYLMEGEFTLPSLSGLEGVTIEGAADGSTKLNAVNSFNFGENTVIKNVTFKTSGSNSVRYGITSGDVVYENCVFEGKQYGYHVDNANGGTITFNNCTFYGRNALASNGTYVFNNCTFKYTYSNYNTTNIYSEATFNDCAWDSKLELYIEAGAKAIIDGEEITQRVVFISDARALESFQQSVNWKNESYAGVTVMLTADIDMNDAYYANWTPIGQTGATQFQGTFDGHGHTIKNLNINSSKQTGAHYSTGLFGWLNKATVKNLTIENATVTGNHNVGVIAGYMETSGCTISNCHVINATVVAKHANDDACGDKVGVIVGHAGNAGVKVENCSAKDCTVQAGRDAGQLVGAAKEANVTGCTAENVTVTASGECTGANINNAIIGRVLS